MRLLSLITSSVNATYMHTDILEYDILHRPPLLRERDLHTVALWRHTSPSSSFFLFLHLLPLSSLTSLERSRTPKRFISLFFKTNYDDLISPSSFFSSSSIFFGSPSLVRYSPVPVLSGVAC
jgi:hypothetical protein